LPPVTPPVCCSDQAITQRWRWVSLLNESYRRTACYLPSCARSGCGLVAEDSSLCRHRPPRLQQLLSRFAQRKILYLVSNRAAADEAERKMPSNVTVRTAHASRLQKRRLYLQVTSGRQPLASPTIVAFRHLSARTDLPSGTN
jgi:hypothetical protein